MLRNIILLLLIVLPVCLYGQGDTLFFIGDAPENFYLSDKSKAMYYRTSTLKDLDRYKVDYFRMDHTLYVSARSLYKDTIVLDGLYIEYDSVGKKQEYGNYKLGHKVGQWKLKRLDIDKIWAVTNYWTGNKDTSYEMLSFYPSGKLKRRQYLIKDSIRSGTCFNEDGTTKPFTPFDLMPDPSYDPLEFVVTNIIYPSVAVNMGSQGKVKVRFVVDEQGKIGEVMALNDAETLVAKAAVAVVKKMPRWKPGLLDDIPTKIYFTIPINFKLD